MTRLKRAETRRERRDVSALRAIRERRAQARTSIGRGDLYVVPGHEDSPYEVWRVNRRGVVLKARGRAAFLVFEGANAPDGWWVKR
jgi:hypothetical protein